MSDALVSPPVAGVAGTISIVLLAIAVRQTKRNGRENIIPLMGVMGAFVFAAQMLNFTIPGTGSSGHIVGGVLLASVLGPWAAFIALTSVLIIQALLFADGGVMALGCNIINMAGFACLVAYPLIFKSLMTVGAKIRHIMTVSVITCIVGLELGAVAVSLETGLSGITVLPTMRFLGFMLPIHLLIGLFEGIATGAVISFISRTKPAILDFEKKTGGDSRLQIGKTVLVTAVVALVLAASFSIVASSSPDGLEWSILNLTGSEEVVSNNGKAYDLSDSIQQATALMPDYNTTAAGIIGSGTILLAAFGLSYIFKRKRA